MRISPGRTRAAIRSLRRDVSATTTILFALAMIPAIGCIGLGIDYLSGISQKERLAAAADAAAISAINAAQSYITANASKELEPFLSLDAKAAGEAQGARAFALNGAGSVAATGATAAVTVFRLGQTITANVQYSGRSPTTFGGLFGVRALQIGGAAGSSLTMGNYIDFYIALDVSGSMGLPTSPDDQTRLAALNGGCQFACHFNGQSSGYTAARGNGIKLRIDTVGTAVAHLVATAQKTQTIPGQYRIGAYPFIGHAMEAAPLSTDLTAVAAVGTGLGATYLDQGLAAGSRTAMGSGGTHFETVLPDIQSHVAAIGTGSSALSPKPFLFIITDGVDNAQSYDGKTWSAGGSKPQRPNNFGYCDYAKQMQVTIAVLYIPYLRINNVTGGESGEANAVNGVIPFIPGDLKACASPNFFFTASSDADIDQALQAMFNQALQAARLVK